MPMPRQEKARLGASMRLESEKPLSCCIGTEWKRNHKARVLTNAESVIAEVTQLRRGISGNDAVGQL